MVSRLPAGFNVISPENSDIEATVADFATTLETWEGGTITAAIEAEREQVFMDIATAIRERTSGSDPARAYLELPTEEGEHRIFLRPYSQLQDTYRITANLWYHEPPTFSSEAVVIDDYLLNLNLLSIIATQGIVRRSGLQADWSRGDMTGPRLAVQNGKLYETVTDPSYLPTERIANELHRMRRRLFRGSDRKQLVGKESESFQMLLCIERANSLLQRLGQVPLSALQTDIQL